MGFGLELGTADSCSYESGPGSKEDNQGKLLNIFRL